MAENRQVPAAPDRNDIQEQLYNYIWHKVNDPLLTWDMTGSVMETLAEESGTRENGAQWLARAKKLAARKITVYFTVRHDILLDEFDMHSCVLDLLTHNDVEILPTDLGKQGELIERLHKTLLEMPEPLREALLLRYFDRMSPEEIAQKRRTSPEVVVRKLKQGRKLVQKVLDAFEQEKAVKLNYVGVVPLLLWLSRQYRQYANVPLTNPDISPRYFSRSPEKQKERIAVTGMKIVIGLLIVAIIVCGVIFLPKLFDETPASAPTGTQGSQTGDPTGTQGDPAVQPNGQQTGDGTESGETGEAGTANPGTTGENESQSPTETDKPTQPTQNNDTEAPTDGPTTPVIPL